MEPGGWRGRRFWAFAEICMSINVAVDDAIGDGMSRRLPVVLN
jgi:hypothetical protein